MLRLRLKKKAPFLLLGVLFKKTIKPSAKGAIMQNQSNELDFSGQVFHVGLDVHEKNWSVCIHSNRKELKRFSMNPSPHELVRYMHRHYPDGIYISAYEAGFCGFWIHRVLEQNGFRNLVIHAPDVPTTDKEKNSKSDKIDAGKIARELENQSLKSIYIPDSLHQALRSLYRLRSKTIQNRTRVKNRIKGHLYFYGIKIPSHQQIPHWSKRFITWLQSVEFSHQSAKAYLDFCLEELAQHSNRVAQITKMLRRHLKDAELSEQVRLLRSIPGIGTVCSLAFYSELMTMDRFPKFDQLKAYCGLAPSVEGTGDTCHVKGLSNRRNRYLRHLIIEAAWVAIRKDPVLLLAYNKLTQRMKPQDAIVRIATKLLRRIRYVWKNQKEYVQAVVQ